jgi:hypothetical protein
MAKNTNKIFKDTSIIEMLAINSTLKIRDIVKGFVNDSLNDGGVFSMDGTLNIRPRYQRAYIADTSPYWRENLINSIICGFPINRIYIGVDSAEEKSVMDVMKEMLDGQQRTITICEFILGAFAIEYNGMTMHFHNLPTELQERILDYDLDITYCKGTEAARIAWFKRINQPNSILTQQELRNSTYVGAWLEAQKRRFCSASAQARKQITDKNDKYCASYYASGCKIERCDYLEVALDWISYYDYPELRNSSMDERICRYMGDHQHDEPNDLVFEHYKKVIDWANATFLNNGLKTQKYPQSFAGVDWGRLYAEYGENTYDTIYTTKRIAELLDIQFEFSKPAGLYEWILRGEKREDRNLMSPRTFRPQTRQEQFKLQGGEDPISGEKFEDESQMEAHHIVPWTDGGTTNISNCVLLSPETHKKVHNGLLNNAQVLAKRDELMERVRERAKTMKRFNEIA